VAFVTVMPDSVSQAAGALDINPTTNRLCGSMFVEVTPEDPAGSRAVTFTDDREPELRQRRAGVRPSARCSSAVPYRMECVRCEC
jgi:hypothetical protein